MVSIVTTGTMLVLPCDDPDDDYLLIDFLAVHPLARSVQPTPGPAASIVPRVCAAITRAAPAPPLVIVAAGSSALLLPGVALSQRSLHRRVAEYLLIEPSLPPVTDSWPDAPVTVATDSPDRSALVHLRGWTGLPLVDLARWRPAE
jgi:hypothetical protein